LCQRTFSVLGSLLEGWFLEEAPSSTLTPAPDIGQENRGYGLLESSNRSAFPELCRLWTCAVTRRVPKPYSLTSLDPDVQVLALWLLPPLVIIDHGHCPEKGPLLGGRTPGRGPRFSASLTEAVAAWLQRRPAGSGPRSHGELRISRGHFQYNGVCFGLCLAAVGCVASGRTLTSILTFLQWCFDVAVSSF